jgi:DeoR family transcriptional regulator of aga operon
LDWGISSPTIEKANLKKKMIKVADQVVLVADHSKFYKKSFARIAGIDVIDFIITDSSLEENTLKELSDRGIDIRSV